MLFLYTPIKENLHSDDLGSYISFGIICFDSQKQIIASVSDISVNEAFVSELCDRFTAYQLAPIHLPDIIQDIL